MLECFGAYARNGVGNESINRENTGGKVKAEGGKGMCAEMVTDADNFNLTLPQNLSIQRKAIALTRSVRPRVGAVLLSTSYYPPNHLVFVLSGVSTLSATGSANLFCLTSGLTPKRA